jgi:EAL domain-containing protein (putative c-di-GMP-specific phosphodiesterase class I)
MMAICGTVLQDINSAQQLQAALDHDQFELYYQPLIDMRDRSIHGVEALLRWRHPERGLLNPADFIPLAEETGLIVAIGLWALRRACSDHRRMQRATRRDLLLSVNVSSRQLDEPAFISGLADIVRQTGIAPRLLQLEITESIFLRDSMRIGALFQAIRALGVKIAFDDFGTGYSSLNYLAAYPVDLVKIDQHFVKRMSKSYVHAEIVQLIVHLAQNIGMNVSAEGVENLDQAEALSQLGCNIAQGYLYSPPLPLTSLTAMLEQTLDGPSAHRPKNVASVPGRFREAFAK